MVKATHAFVRMCVLNEFFLDFGDIIAQCDTCTVSVSRAIDREGEKLERNADLTQLQASRLTAQPDWGILTAYIIGTYNMCILFDWKRSKFAFFVPASYKSYLCI